MVATLAGAVATLFKINETKSQREIAELKVRIDESDKKHDECLRDRIEISKQLARLEGRLSHFIKDVQDSDDGST